MGGIQVEQYRELQGNSSPGQGGVGGGVRTPQAPPTQPEVLSLSFAPCRSWVFLSVTHSWLCVTSSESSQPGIGLGSAWDSPPVSQTRHLGHRYSRSWGQGLSLGQGNSGPDPPRPSRPAQGREPRPACLPASLVWVTPIRLSFPHPRGPFASSTAPAAAHPAPESLGDPGTALWKDATCFPHSEDPGTKDGKWPLPGPVLM